MIGRMYKIVSLVHEDPDDEICYLGSTTKTLEKRLRGHENNFRQWKAGKFPYVTSFELLK